MASFISVECTAMVYLYSQRKYIQLCQATIMNGEKYNVWVQSDQQKEILMCFIL